jgi:regulator of replication initiation timing
MKALFTFLLLSTVCFGQSKKEQIEALNHSIDSLSAVLQTTRDNTSKDIESREATIDSLNSEIAQLKSDVSGLETSVSTLEKDKSKLTLENEKFKTDLEEISKKNLELEAKLKAIKETASANLITKNSIGQITLGMNLSKLQSLYDVVEVTEEGEGGSFTKYYCKSSNQTYYQVRLNNKQEVVWIYTENPFFRTKEGITCSSSASEIKDLLADVTATYTADGTDLVHLMYSDNIAIFVKSNESAAIQDELLMEGKKTSDLPNDLKIVGFSVYFR